MSEFLCNLNGNLRNDAHRKMGPVYCLGQPRADIGKPLQSVQISIRVYSRKPRTVIDFKEVIREEMRAIRRSVCKDVTDNFVPGLKKCTELNSGYLEQMLWSTQERADL